MQSSKSYLSSLLRLVKADIKLLHTSASELPLTSSFNSEPPSGRCCNDSDKYAWKRYAIPYHIICEHLCVQ